MRARRLMVPAVLSALVVFAAASCANPRQQASTAQALSDAATEISGLRNDIAQVQDQVDSLRTMVMKQDTLITRIMAVNNIPR
jgi:septal ring factor EnvC (AmiA/AmiB activator)